MRAAVTLDNCGHEVRVEASPQHAVSLNQGTTEILLSSASPTASRARPPGPTP